MSAAVPAGDGLKRLGWAAAWGLLWLVATPVARLHQRLALAMRVCHRRSKGWPR